MVTGNWLLFYFFVPIFLVFWSVVWSLVGRLREAHYAVWLDLDSPVIPCKSRRSYWLLSKFTLFSSAYKALNDPRVNTLVLWARVLWGTLILVLIVNALLAWSGYPTTFHWAQR